jgi:hypothetical protein
MTESPADPAPEVLATTTAAALFGSHCALVNEAISQGNQVASFPGDNPDPVLPMLSLLEVERGLFQVPTAQTSDTPGSFAAGPLLGGFAWDLATGGSFYSFPRALTHPTLPERTQLLSPSLKARPPGFSVVLEMCTSPPPSRLLLTLVLKF